MLGWEIILVEKRFFYDSQIVSFCPHYFAKYSNYTSNSRLSIKWPFLGPHSLGSLYYLLINNILLPNFTFIPLPQCYYTLQGLSLAWIHFYSPIPSSYVIYLGQCTIFNHLFYSDPQKFNLLSWTHLFSMNNVLKFTCYFQISVWFPFLHYLSAFDILESPQIQHIK